MKTVFTAVAALGCGDQREARAASEDLRLSDDAPTQTFDFDGKGIEGWTMVAGQWAVEEMAGAPSGTKVRVQRATKNDFNVIVAPIIYGDVDITMTFKTISGRQDASGGIVFRFTDGKYDVVRANALENNFRLYSYGRGRRQLASTTVTPPALGQWHSVRVVAVGDQIQAGLNGTQYLNHRDSRLRSGAVGLWTTAIP